MVRSLKSRRLKGSLYPIPDFDVSWALEVDDDSHPVLQITSSSDAPRMIRATKAIAEIRDNNFSYNCFFTGVECFIGPVDIFGKRADYPWLANKEHLLSRIHHAKHYPNNLSKTIFVFSGSRINYEFGDIPASVKLLVRRFLKNKQYDRKDVLNVNGSFDAVFDHMIDLEKSFTLYGRYPWHPQSYSLVSHRKAAREFLDKINQMDREWFEQLTRENRFEHFDNTILPIELL